MARAKTHPAELQPTLPQVRRVSRPFQLRSRYEPSPKRVLLVVEEEALRAEISEALAVDLHHVIELEDSWELWDYFQSTPRPNPRPDAIIVALGLPGPGTLEIIAGLGNLVALPPMIGLSSSGDDTLYAEARRLGFAFVFDMPIVTDDLRYALRSTPGGDFEEVPLALERRLNALDRGTRWLAHSA